MYYPFNLLRSFKDGRFHPRVRHAPVCLFLSPKGTQITVCVYIRSAHSVLSVEMTRKHSLYAYRTNLWRTAVGGTCRFRGSQGRTHECFRVVMAGGILVQDTCHWALWAALRSKTSNRERGVRMHANSDTEA